MILVSDWHFESLEKSTLRWLVISRPNGIMSAQFKYLRVTLVPARRTIQSSESLLTILQKFTNDRVDIWNLRRSTSARSPLSKRSTARQVSGLRPFCKILPVHTDGKIGLMKRRSY